MVALKAELRAAGLPLGGRKRDLVERLMGFSSATGMAKEAAIAGAAAAAQRTKAKRQEMAIKTKLDKRTPVQRTATPRWTGEADAAGTTARFVSWNVNGLRAVLKRPEPLVELVRTERPHVLCLQETKLQEQHVPECEAALRALLPPEYQFFAWDCSTTRKGYSGVALIVDPTRFDARAWQQATVVKGVGVADADVEGRSLTLHILPALSLTTVYVPNSGAELKRLGFRVGEFDRGLAKHLDRTAAGAALTLCCGDLNVANEDADFYNPEEPRTTKQAGTTPEERASIKRTLADTGFVDTFRHVHGAKATGVFSYWSQRARNRPVNRGLRLDYFLASPAGVAGGAVVDAFVLDHVQGSDHCPVGIDVRVDGLLK